MGTQLHDIGLQQDHLEQVRDAFAGLGRDRRKDGVPPQFF